MAKAFLNINNVFNRAPNWGETVVSGLWVHNDGNVPYYDTVGIYARVGVRFRL